MYQDYQNRFSNAQAITVDANSSNVVDTGSTADVGPGTPIQIAANVTEAFLTLTSLNISLITSAAENMSSPTTLWTKPFALSELGLNAKLDLPPVPAGALRYLALSYEVVGSSATAGKITAGIISDDQKNTPTSDFS